MLEITDNEGQKAMTSLENFLLTRESKTYSSYYNGKMSFALHGKEWEQYVHKTYPGIDGMQTSENIFKDVIDLFVANLVPTPDELKGFSDTLVPLLCRGEAPVLFTKDGVAHFPEHYEMISDGNFTVAAIFTRSLEKMEDYITFAYSDGRTELYSKPVPSDLTTATREGYKWVESTHGNTLFRFNLDDKGMGGALAALQDRTNHSILDLTTIAEMYARPFWYLMNVELPAVNPYLPAAAQPDTGTMKEQKTDTGAGRIFTTSSDGPFGQLTPPTISDMIGYHDSIIAKVSQSTGIPEFYFKPGGGAVPSGVALKVLSRRFNNKVGRIRDSIEEQLRELAALLGVKRPDAPEVKEGEEAPEQEDIVIWDATDDLLQEALDAHGIALINMGYPLEYVAEVVTPGVNLDDYLDDGFNENPMPTPDQVAAYAANPGQEAGKPQVNPLHPSNGQQPPNLRPVN